MSPHDFLSSIGIVLAMIAVAAAIELAVPLRAAADGRGPRRRANLAMTAVVLSFAFVLTTGVTIASVYLPALSPRLMAAAGIPAGLELVAGIVALDFAYGYVAHRTMHASPALWKVHRVHHSDDFVDATTGFRTHPVEVAWRHAWLLATVWILGVPAPAVAAFRLLSAVNGVFEHANIRVAPALDAAIARVWVTPNMHKVHHSRDRYETDSNYGNLFTVHDRVFGTFLPTARAFSVRYGLDDADPAQMRSCAALLAMPWRRSRPQGVDASALEAAA